MYESTCNVAQIGKMLIITRTEIDPLLNFVLFEHLVKNVTDTGIYKRIKKNRKNGHGKWQQAWEGGVRVAGWLLVSGLSAAGGWVQPSLQYYLHAID